MLLPDYAWAVSTAEGLKVLDQGKGKERIAQPGVEEEDTGGQLVPFILNRSQRRILKAALRTRRLVIGKGRQFGASTVLAFLLMLIALMNPGLPLCIVADEQKKAEKILAKIKSWLKQMGVKLTVDNVRSIELPNGSVIDALSAISPAEEGESRVGRVNSYAVIHATEMSFWRNAGAVWAALTSTKLANALLWVESTGAPGETLFRSIFNNPSWTQLFFGIEGHRAYTAPPSSISDSTWAELQAQHGFTDRASAAWWWAKLHGELMGDVFRALREYPIKPEHMFVFAVGQHIKTWLEAQVRVDGPWDFYEEPNAVGLWDEPVGCGIDTAVGVGRDASGIAFIGHQSGKPKATYRCNTIAIPDFIEVAKRAIETHRPIAHVVESNGCGSAVWQALRHITGAVEQWSGANSGDNGELHLRRDRFRWAVESKEFPVGGHLLAEVKSSTVTKKGRFEGMDDVISACSFIRQWRDAHPYEPPVDDPYDDPTRYSVRRRMEQEQLDA